MLRRPKSVSYNSYEDALDYLYTYNCDLDMKLRRVRANALFRDFVLLGMICSLTVEYLKLKEEKDATE